MALPLPLVTVVIPLYNSEMWIEKSLACVLCQSYPHFEVIVVDDGSSDRGADLVRQCKDRRVRLARQENRGLAGARNTGIRHGRGAFFAFLDADDLWKPNKLSRHVAQLGQNPDVGLSFSWSALIDEQDEPLGLVQSPRHDRVDAPHLFCRNPVGNGSSPVIRREALEDIVFLHPVGGYACWFDESFRQSEDIECWTRIISLGKWRFACVPEALTLYRVNAGGLSANVEQQLATWQRFRQKVAGYNPALESLYGDLAEAYQLRYLARRAIQGHNARTGLSLILRALRKAPRILYEEPGRTGITLCAAFSLAILPEGLFQWLAQTMTSLLRKTPMLRA